jgi:hypothetical protein
LDKNLVIIQGSAFRGSEVTKENKRHLTQFSRLEAAPTERQIITLPVGAASSREGKNASKKNQLHVAYLMNSSVRQP